MKIENKGTRASPKEKAEIADKKASTTQKYVNMGLFLVPGMFRIGGVDIRRPGYVRYFDAI